MTWWYLLLAFFQLFSLKTSAFSVGIGVWINGRGSTTTTASTQAPPTSSVEYTAFQAWKSAITEDPSGILASWVGPDVCSYRDLSIIHLNSNRFSGTIPESFRELQYLTELDLSNNQFSGPFPTSTLRIPNLIYLDLRFNSFSGEVPDELFVGGLDGIFLNNNQFEGQIPMILWNSQASVITLANNKFSGSIPASFGHAGPGIREALFLNNELTGCIPEGIGFLSDVEVLDLSFNSLTGHLPSSLSCLSDIEVLNIAHNQFSGELPDLVCDLKSLLNLTVSYNFFSGFSQDCDKLFFRNVGFDFSGNCIPGRDMQRPPPECMGIPGGGLSCLRIPAAKAVACSRAMVQGSQMPAMPYTSPASFPYLP
ncbi:Leucine rich repeat N-terminal domain [Musa troglodytarum]|uniref:Cell wall hydroxyproline-rich glycoprotein n=1 Tax=Musa troglodytarum TaxID=320322 RepID=A0A9E7KJM8_9LILI|nr:Leucine rich repeat N-terminal domain [Musa troglodytarum]